MDVNVVGHVSRVLGGNLTRRRWVASAESVIHDRTVIHNLWLLVHTASLWASSPSSLAFTVPSPTESASTPEEIFE
jgi:hypothetical protein